MRTIDIHAHVTPVGFVEAGKRGEDWHGMPLDAMNVHRNNPKTYWTPEERLADMNSLGVDVQVLSTNAYFYNYDGDPGTVSLMTQECNNYVAELVKDHPDRFSGFSTLPMQDIKASIAELERSMGLGLKGAMIGDNVNGETFDEKKFLPFWKAAESLGAVILVHQGGETVVNHRISRYHLPNTIGNPADRALTFAALVFGGVMDA
ncbi:MAG: amidohydrolase family protein, partial [Chloroflexi bacterium]|nr:amidohydrolase family protein [Chloroflexota bacterium]